MTITALTDIIGFGKKGEVYAKAKEKISVVAVHGHVLIVENSRGRRFPITSDKTDYERIKETIGS